VGFSDDPTSGTHLVCFSFPSEPSLVPSLGANQAQSAQASVFFWNCVSPPVDGLFDFVSVG